MRGKYTTLSELARQSQVYETMPIPLSATLKRSVWRSLIAGSASTVGLLIIAGTPLLHIGYSFGDITVPVSNWVLNIGHSVAPLMIVLNIISVILMLVVFITSHGMTHDVGEPIHWIVGFGSIPPVVTSSITGLVITMLIAIFLLKIAIEIFLVVGMLIALLGGFRGK